MVKINIKKKDLYLISAILVFIFGAGMVIALNPQDLNGHSFSEVGIPSCTDGQVLKWSGAAWTCGTDNSGGTGGGLPANGCYWTAIQTHGNYVCPDGYYVSGICLTNDQYGCNPGITGDPGNQGAWVTDGGVRCCKAS
jgi:hypothetical protein